MLNYILVLFSSSTTFYQACSSFVGTSGHIVGKVQIWRRKIEIMTSLNMSELDFSKFSQILNSGINSEKKIMYIKNKGEKNRSNSI